MGTILIVDDEPANRLLLTALIRHMGHVPIEAGDAAEGMEKIRAHKPDLVVLDLGLPGVHGAKMLQQLRADPLTAAAKIALYTATAPNDAMRDFMELMQVAHIIPKPGEPHDILAALGAALE